MDAPLSSLPVLGLVGPIASGKSFIADILVPLGACRLDADAAGHAVLADPEVVAALRQRWGDDILQNDGAVHRPSVAERVFGDSPEKQQQRRFLESLTHPRILGRLQAEAAAAERQGASGLVLDAPLLLESGWKSLCREIWFIEAPRELRLERVRRRGWNDEQLQAREQSQWPESDKRAHADRIVRNHGDPQLIAETVQRLWREFLASCSPV